MNAKRRNSLLILCLMTALVQSDVMAAGLCRKAMAEKTQKTRLKEDDVVKDNVDDVKLVSKSDLRNAAKILMQTIRYNYGPRTRKQVTEGVVWKTAEAEFIRSVEKMNTEADFVFGFSRFLAQMNDAHISMSLTSTLKWLIGIQTSYDKKTDKYILNYIEREQISEENFVSGVLPPIKAELVAIDGMSMEKFRQSQPQLNANGNDLTNKMMFARKIFRMSEASGIPLSRMENKGRDFTFQWTENGVHRVETVRLKYSVEGFGLTDIATIAPKSSPGIEDMLAKQVLKQVRQTKPALPGFVQAPKSAARTELDRQIKAFDNLFNTSKGKDKTLDIISSPKAEGQSFKIAQTEPLFKLPKDFKKIELPENIAANFDPSLIFAGTFIHEGRRVGLLRIPTYGVDDIASSIPMIQYLVRRLEASSDYLVLDQMHNPGGSVTYSDFWIKAFVGNFNID